MTLWLNKKEQQYLVELIETDMGDFPEGDILTGDNRNKLYEKIKSVKV